MLTQTLPGLERDGLVRRTVHPDVPVRVEYSLAEAGRTLLEPIHALQKCAIEHLSDVSAAQDAYDRATVIRVAVAGAPAPHPSPAIPCGRRTAKAAGRRP